MAVLQLRLLGYPMANIRRALHKLTGLGHHDLAKRAGVSRVTITNTMTGHQKSPRVQQQIADIFEVPLDVLFGADSERPAD